MDRLHLVNGDVVAEKLREALPGDTCVPWRDLLHEGPVPAGLALEEMSGLRARFVSETLDDRAFGEVHAEFVARDAALRSFRRHPEVTLWFEHDLYDQLQLLQVLDWFSRRERGRTALTLVSIDRHPEVERFLGLGQLSAAQLAELDGGRREVGGEQLKLASRAWAAFCADRPDELAGLAGEDLAPLPFLRAALVRHLEQFPWTSDGLSRSEREVLRVVSEGERELGRVFRASQIEREECPFMSDRAFLFHIGAIAGGRANLLRFEDGASAGDPGRGLPADEVWDRRVALTEVGTKVLKGTADCVGLYGIDRWLGGVHLHGAKAAWRWDGRRGTLLELR